MNLNSTKQIRQLLYEELQLPILKYTDKGQPSTSVDTLNKLLETTKNPIIGQILKHREITKLLGTYVARWLDNADKNGRVHFYINQTATVSGRTGGDSQQIPKRTKTADKIRRAIIAPPEYVLCEADFSQLEPRILAHLSKDKKLIEIFNTGQDIYKATVAAALNKPINETTKEDRDLGKVIVLANNYGQTAWGLAKQLNIDEKEAQVYLDNYFNYYSGVKLWRMETIARAKRLGYTETILGRRSKVSLDIALPSNWKNKNGKWVDVSRWKREAAEREASNRPIQGSSQDIIKTAMIQISKRLSNKSKLLLMVHDSLLFEIPENYVANSIPVIRQIMETALPLTVPTPVEISVGKNLAEMQEVK